MRRRRRRSITEPNSSLNQYKRSCIKATQTNRLQPQRGRSHNRRRRWQFTPENNTCLLWCHGKKSTVERYEDINRVDFMENLLKHFLILLIKHLQIEIFNHLKQNRHCHKKGMIFNFA